MQQEQLLMGEWLDSLMMETWGGKALTLPIDGKLHMVATNGHALVLVAGAGPIEASDYYRKCVEAVVALDADPNRRSFTMPLAELRAWLPPDPSDIPCPTCLGGQKKEFKCEGCGGTGIDECPHCGHDAECPVCGGAKKSLQCHECEGDGTVRAEPRPAPVVPGSIIDRRILQRFLGPLLRGEQVRVTVGGSLDVAFFYGDGWTILVMPFRYEESDVLDGGASIRIAQGVVPLGGPLRGAA